jgi:hypothetical protein
MSSETPSFKLCPVNLTVDCIDVSRAGSCHVMSCISYLLHIDARCAFEHLISVSANPGILARDIIPAPPHDFLSRQLISTSQVNAIDIYHSPLASSTCPDLSVPSGSVRLTISLYRGNLTYPPLTPLLPNPAHLRLTFSTMTKGPLMPPMVLYRILGVTL